MGSGNRKVNATTGKFTEKILYNFCAKADCADGEFPLAGLITDSSGNLYGTTSQGGTNQAGTVFELVK